MSPPRQQRFRLLLLLRLRGRLVENAADTGEKDLLLHGRLIVEDEVVVDEGLSMEVAVNEV